MTNQEYFFSLYERVAHNDTMKPLNPLERQWLVDFTSHREALTDEERACFDSLEIFVDWE
jgi:hypothetical protein